MGFPMETPLPRAPEDLGIALGLPSGGAMGIGTINVSDGYFVNGTAQGSGTFLPLAGGTLTGDLDVSGSVEISGTFNVSNNMVLSSDGALFLSETILIGTQSSTPSVQFLNDNSLEWVVGLDGSNDFFIHNQGGQGLLLDTSASLTVSGNVSAAGSVFAAGLNASGPGAGLYLNDQGGGGQEWIWAVGSGNAVLTLAGSGFNSLVTEPSGILTVAGPNQSQAAEVIISFLDSATGSALRLGRSRGTNLAPTANLSNDQLGTIGFFGYGATGYSSSVIGIDARAAENWTDTAQGARVSFTVTPKGTITPQTGMTLLDDGSLFTAAGINATGPITSAGVNSGFWFNDRGNSSEQWTLYAAQGAAALNASPGVGTVLLIDTSGNITFAGQILANQSISSKGNGAAFFFADRNNAGQEWAWYAHDGLAALFAARDLFTMDISGNATFVGPVTLSGAPTQPNQATTKQYVDAGKPTNANFTGFVPVALTAPSLTMLGLGYQFTPTVSGRLLVVIAASISQSTVAATGHVSLRFGTGTQPAHGAPDTGIFGNADFQFIISPNEQIPATLVTVLPGLSIGTQYWFDVAVVISTGTVNYFNHSFSFLEV